LLFERGAVLDDPAVAPVLLNDADALRAAVRAIPSLLDHRTTLISSFTSLVGVSLLHVAAEYGNLDAARTLVEAGADVNATAAVDEHGLNGHTPLFHSVNSIGNRSEPIMRLLLAAGAKPDVRLAGITWGKGYSAAGDGYFESRDGGDTWQQLSETYEPGWSISLRSSPIDFATAPAARCARV
jgi:ankyrin repeat protein